MTSCETVAFKTPGHCRQLAEGARDNRTLHSRILGSSQRTMSAGMLSNKLDRGDVKGCQYGLGKAIDEKLRLEGIVVNSNEILAPLETVRGHCHP